MTVRAGVGGRSVFQDIVPRLLSGIVLSAVGLSGVWTGGWVFPALVTAVVALIIWELHRMVAPVSQRRLGVLLAACAGTAVFLTGHTPIAYLLPLAMLPSVVGFAVLQGNRRLFGVCAALVILAGFGLTHLRTDFGLVWMLWLMLVVIATDTFGYLCGRLIGGRKFWPRVSPNKTWSGTVAGWIAAALIGAGFVVYAGATIAIVPISVATAMAAQIGDISESALKRKMGVKDASRLIPGHGGLFDRFDGMMGAAIFLLVIERVMGFPPVTAG